MIAAILDKNNKNDLTLAESCQANFMKFKFENEQIAGKLEAEKANQLQRKSKYLERAREMSPCSNIVLYIILIFITPSHGAIQGYKAQNQVFRT